jgi:uncharacterized protein YbjT (DUF2867 family)
LNFGLYEAEKLGESSMAKTAVIAGATGLVGRELVDLLLHGDDFDQVIVLVRRSLQRNHPKLTEYIVDFDQLEHVVPDEIWHEASIFCTLGTTMKQAGTRDNFRRVDYDYPLALARIAKRHQAKQFVIVTAMGADAKSMVFYSRVKGELEVQLQALQLNSLSILRPSLLVGHRQEQRIGEQVANRVAGWLSFIFVGPLQQYKPVSGRTVAMAMERIARSARSGTRFYTSAQWFD